ncbi:cation:proton antiporter subunit C [Candidatus Deianiraea vastatrix]|uniref:Monovalent cation/H+ antiporter subunit C n=1 Tax=Candidatus Deianiraea vastatrix TaxID=2163644 RepID=A0A5B8XDD2_9RICK|nr:cation:proton antiporter subunit C [Candidatus Deianiraea vastatrix]QED23250.1 Putative monovalent cation/H+ antiporter subunit C [Candidatus Deianiraea vastatrix]
MFSFIPAYLIYTMIIVVGLIGIVVSDNLIKKVMSLNITQAGILLFYISICYKHTLNPPIIKDGLLPENYINPIPQVLMLTAIVVGLSITSIALALIIKISKLYETIYQSQIDEIDHNDAKN